MGGFRVHCRVIPRQGAPYRIEVCIERIGSKGVPAIWPLPRMVVFASREAALQHAHLVIAGITDIDPVSGEPRFTVL